MTATDDLFILPADQEKLLHLERTVLMDRISDLLRDNIVNGHIRPGTRLIERQLAELLGISRVPVREALIQLEQEGLIISRPNGRYVIELSEQDIAKLYEVRHALEKLAVELAAQNTSAERASALREKLKEMREAIAQQDLSLYVKKDFEIHRLIWRQADNPYLLAVLRTLTGPIFMFMADNASHFGWEQTLDLHQNLIDCINSGDTRTAVESFERHMKDGLHRAHRVFQHQD